ncbi:MAG: lysoplasmalogenase [Acidimicrobiia bacterium]
MIGIGLTVAATAWLVVSIRANRGQFAKPIASLGFLLVLVEPLEPGTRTTLIVIGLVLGAIGDVALMGRSDISFMLGLGAFLLGHVAYLVALALDATDPFWLGIGSLLALTLAVVVMRWLRPHLEAPFTVAVPIYVVVICLMLTAGIGAGPERPLAAVGAVLFAASDLFVARQRFVTSEPINPSVGLPLYYAAQLLIAWSVVAG